MEEIKQSPLLLPICKLSLRLKSLSKHRCSQTRHQMANESWRKGKESFWCLFKDGVKAMIQNAVVSTEWSPRVTKTQTKAHK